MNSVISKLWDNPSNIAAPLTDEPITTVGDGPYHQENHSGWVTDNNNVYQISQSGSRLFVQPIYLIFHENWGGWTLNFERENYSILALSIFLPESTWSLGPNTSHPKQVETKRTARFMKKESLLDFYTFPVSAKTAWYSIFSIINRKSW